MDEGNSRYRPFPETRWSLVLRAAEGGQPERQQALADLCALYWPPVYAYIRSQGHGPHDAEDLTQGFFASFLQRESFSQTDPSRGKLRSYLLAAAKHYLASERRDAGRLKRGGGVCHLSIDAVAGEARCALIVSSDALSPDRLFDRQWATTLLETVIERVEASYQNAGKETLFAALRPFIQSGGETTGLAKIAGSLGMTDNALRVAIHRLRHRYAKTLRDTVADTLSEGEDPEVELRHLIAVFG